MSADSVAQDQIRAIVDRILRLKEEGRAINSDIREVYAEAKGNGFDKTALGKLVTYVEKRNAGAAEMQEAEALFDLYLSAYDGAKPSHVHAHAREDRSRAKAADAVSRGDDVGGPQHPSDPGNAVAVEPGRHTSVSAGTDPAPISAAAFRQFGDHNPETHFLNSKGLVRLHGCTNPENCGSSQPRAQLCFQCSVTHDGPTYQPEAVE